MTATQSLRFYQLFLKHFNNDTDAKAFVDELEIVLEEKSITDKEIYSNKNDLDSFRKDVERLSAHEAGNENRLCRNKK